MPQKPAARIANWYLCTEGPYKLRIEDETKPLTKLEAMSIARSIFSRSGAFCGQCGQASQLRYVRAIEPDTARCYECHNNDYSSAFARTTRT